MRGEVEIEWGRNRETPATLLQHSCSFSPVGGSQRLESGTFSTGPGLRPYLGVPLHGPQEVTFKGKWRTSESVIETLHMPKLTEEIWCFSSNCEAVRWNPVRGLFCKYENVGCCFSRYILIIHRKETDHFWTVNSQSNIFMFSFHVIYNKILIYWKDFPQLSKSSISLTVKCYILSAKTKKHIYYLLWQALICN